jgi:hypothetical protein
MHWEGADVRAIVVNAAFFRFEMQRLDLERYGYRHYYVS